MASELFYLPQQPVFNSLGLPAGGAEIYFFLSGTTTLAPIYADSDLSTPLANPVQADGFGRAVTVYLDASITYRLRLTDIRGAQLTPDIDPYIPGTISGILSVGVAGKYLAVAADGSIIVSAGTGADAGLRTDLAAVSGGLLVGFQYDATATSRSQQGKLLELLQSPQDRGADKTGSANSSAAFLAADAVGSFTVPPGSYKIATSITINSRVRFELGARLNIPNGVTVTFAGGIEAGDYQIFNLFGTGAVAGLAVSRLAWFMADLLNSPTQTIADPFVQAAYTATNGPVDWPRGDWFSDGRGIVVSKGQATRGFGRAQSRMLFTTTTANGLLHTSAEKPSVTGVGFDMASSNTIATSGMMLSFDSNAGNHTVDDVYANAGFNGYYAGNGCNTGKVSNSDFNNMMNTATWKDGGVNIIFDTLSCSAFSDWFDLSSTTGFVAGESITWSGGSGSYGYTTSSTRAKCVINDVSPAVGTVITGSTSGATATLTALHVGHQQGGNRRTGNCAGYGEVNCSWAGGALACASDAITNAHGSRPEYGKTVACFFDHSDGGCQDITLVGAQYIGCWFSARHYIGWYGDKVQYLNLADCHFDANWLDGWTTTANAHDVTVSGGYAAGNNRSNTARAGGLIFGTRIAVLGQRSGGGTTSSSFDGTQANPYKVDASASVIVINSCLISYGNMTNTISGTSSGTNF